LFLVSCFLNSGGRVSNAWITCLLDRDNSGKPELILDTNYLVHAK